jgi:hypothetical protein
MKPIELDVAIAAIAVSALLVACVVYTLYHLIVGC